MHKNVCTVIVNRETEINQLVNKCLDIEYQRNLATKSLKELKRYLTEFGEYCKKKEIYSVHELTPKFLKEYVEQCWQRGNFPLVKAIVWSLRKFGAYLALVQIIPDNPAQYLRHPKIPKRRKLPEYLRASQLRQLLERCAHTRSFQDFTILSLLASTGLRTNEIVTLNRDRVDIPHNRIVLIVKGGWQKKTPLSDQMSLILAKHLKDRNDNTPSVFINKKEGPLSESYIRRMVKTVAADVGIKFPLTCRHLRHTFATHSVDKHGMLITKALLGHSKMTATQVYLHLSPRRFRGLMNQHPYQKKEL